MTIPAGVPTMLASHVFLISSSFRGYSDVMGMESPRIHVGQTGQRGKMNALRASSIIRSDIGASVIRFSSLRLICLNLGASFFSYAISFIGLVAYFPVYSDVYEPAEPAQAMVHVLVLVSQLLLEKDLERFGELHRDV